jgi:hypothetical protein
VIVGGDYAKESEAVDNLAVTHDGGVTWSLRKGLSGYRSVVAYVPHGFVKTRRIIAVGPNGTDYSSDDGETWKRHDAPGFDTASFIRNARDSTVGWAAGKDGAIGKMRLDWNSELLP